MEHFSYRESTLLLLLFFSLNRKGTRRSQTARKQKERTVVLGKFQGLEVNQEETVEMVGMLGNQVVR